MQPGKFFLEQPWDFDGFRLTVRLEPVPDGWEGQRLEEATISMPLMPNGRGGEQITVRGTGASLTLKIETWRRIWESLNRRFGAARP